MFKLIGLMKYPETCNSKKFTKEEWKIAKQKIDDYINDDRYRRKMTIAYIFVKYINGHFEKSNDDIRIWGNI